MLQYSSLLSSVNTTVKNKKTTQWTEQTSEQTHHGGHNIVEGFLCDINKYFLFTKKISFYADLNKRNKEIYVDEELL